MFTTVFCAILDITTGDVRFANAGHNPPLILDSQGVRYLTPESGLMLGVLTDTVFVTECLILEPEGTLFFYTDGVTEAKNTEDAMFGEDRLLKALQIAPQDDLAKMIQYISSEVAHHANGAHQSDDITMLAIKMATK